MSGFVEDFSDVGLGLTKPHSEQFGTLDGDEVRLALVGDRLGQERLTTTGWAVEKNTLGWIHSELQELLRMLDWVLDEFLELPLHRFETTNIAPADVGHLDNGFSERGWIRLAKSEFEVFVCNSELVHDFSVDDVFVDIDELHLASDLLKSGFGAEGSQIGTDVTVSFGSNLEK